MSMFEQYYPDELQHYGVLGMKWGVRRASSSLKKATTTADRDKAVDKLKTHKQKSGEQITKLKAKGVKLNDKYDQKIVKQESKAAKLSQKSAKLEKKSYGMFTSASKAEKLQYKAKKLDVKAKDLVSKAQQARSKIEKNQRMIEAFERGISNIDATLVSAGRKYVED